MNDKIGHKDALHETRPALHDAEDEVGCYEAEAEHFGLEATYHLREEWILEAQKVYKIS